MRLGIVGSVRGVASSNVVGVEVLAGLGIDEVVVVAELGCDVDAIRDLVSEAASAVGASTEVGALGDDFASWRGGCV